MKLEQILSLSLILCLVVTPAFSQSVSRYEVSTGYSFLGEDFSRPHDEPVCHLQGPTASTCSDEMPNASVK
jgi:hypothetical protein